MEGSQSKVVVERRSGEEVVRHFRNKQRRGNGKNRRKATVIHTHVFFILTKKPFFFFETQDPYTHARTLVSRMHARTPYL